MPEEGLTLVRANKSRGGGHWSDDDYDVRNGDSRVTGRIMFETSASEGGGDPTGKNGSSRAALAREEARASGGYWVGDGRNPRWVGAPGDEQQAFALDD